MISVANVAWGTALLAFFALAHLFVIAGGTAEADRTRRLALTAAALFTVLIIARAPGLLDFHRVWAESANLYLNYAYANGPWAALIHPVSNYFDLTANLGSAIGVILGLRYWPIVDTGLGLLVALLLPFAIWRLGFTSRERIGLLLALAAGVYYLNSPETFGTMLHAKAWGAIYCFLVLVSFALHRPVTAWHKALLFIVPFTGPAATFLLLICGTLALVFGRWGSYRYLLWALPGIAVQFICALLPGQNTGFAARPLSIDSLIYAPDLVLVKGLLGPLAPPLFSLQQPGLPQALITAAAVAAVLLIALWLFIRRREQRDLLLLVPAQVFHLLMSLLLSVHGVTAVYGDTAFRYFFPATAMLFMFIAVLPNRREWWACGLAGLFALVVLIDHPTNVYVDGIVFAPSAPTWQEQIAQRTTDPGLRIQIYPGGWGFTLPDCGEHYCGGPGSP